MRDRELPPRVYFRHSAYYFVDTRHKWHHLGSDKRDALRRYADLVTLPQAVTLGRYMDRYLAGVVKNKAPRTQKDNRTEMENLRIAFGHMLPEDLRPTDLYAYMDARGAPVRANREISLLSNLYTHLIEWGVMEHNPCREVRKRKELPRTRYVTDGEFWAVHAIAPPIVQVVMRLLATTGVRIGTLLSLRRQALTADGILVPAVKRGRPLLIEWTLELRQAVEEAKQVRKTGSVWLICRRDGQKYTVSGFSAMWKRVIAKADVERFTLHDLRAKAGSESSDDELLGHQDPKVLRRVYQRAPRHVRPNNLRR